MCISFPEMGFFPWSERLQVLLFLNFPFLLFQLDFLLHLLPSSAAPLSASQKRQSLLASSGEGTGTMLACPGGFTGSSVGDKAVVWLQAGCAFLGSFSWAAHTAQPVFIAETQSRQGGSCSTESCRGCTRALSDSDSILLSLQLSGRVFFFFLFSFF